ncbi:hypothetical protein MD484_g2297, partial [Candolleomyces efflorescens]
MFSGLQSPNSVTSSNRRSLLNAAPVVSQGPQGLLGLPTEILLLIVKKLEWDDVLRLRTTSKLLQNLTCWKDVWTELFERYVEVSMPSPFILSKPLSELSSAEIERIVSASQGGLNMPRSFMSGQAYSLGMPNVRVLRLEIVPGGRWLLAGCADGTVWWYDLDTLSSSKPDTPSEAPPPTLLLESPLPEGTYTSATSIRFSVDFTSDQVLSTEVDNFKVLEHFNLAVVVTYRQTAYVRPKSIQVWRVQVKTGGGNLPTILQAHDRLSSFFEDPSRLVKSISLYGDHVAYYLQNQVVIVNWRTANGKQAGIDSDFMKWYLQSERYTGKVIPFFRTITMFSRLQFLYSLANSGRRSLISAVPWVQRRRPRGLLALPTEILLLIVKELEWDDVLRLRTTNKLLRKLTYSKDVWTGLFLRHLEVSMPTPFILPKPLSECSSVEIERMVWTSQASLKMPRAFMAGQAYSLDIPNTRATELEIVPGGRWLLAGCADGSVWSYDLDTLSSDTPSEARPALLLEPPLPVGTHKRVTSIRFSVDCTSEQASLTAFFRTITMFSRLQFLYSLANSGRRSLISAVPWVQRRRPQGLLALPTEILLLIVKHLEWDDVLRLRTTSKSLRTLTYSKDVWMELFQRYLEVSMPIPFILPKPLSKCSPAEIERMAYSLDIPNTRVFTLEIIPGGRWLLAGCADGTVRWYDLDTLSSSKADTFSGAPPPTLLLESPLPEGTHTSVTGIQFSVDFTSDQVLSTEVDNFKMLEHFNLAVVVTYRQTAHVRPKSIQVWRVQVKTEEGNLPTTLQAHERLSSFFEDSSRVVRSISLYGEHVAYFLRPPIQVVIVNWRTVNGKQAGIDLDFMKWYLPSGRYTNGAIPVILLSRYADTKP